MGKSTIRVLISLTTENGWNATARAIDVQAYDRVTVNTICFDNESLKL